MVRPCFMLIVSVAAAGWLAAQAADYYPDAEWRVSTPDEQGMNSGEVAKLFDAIAQRHLDIHSVVVIRHGYKVVDAHVEPFGNACPHTLNSVTKSFVSALVGCALQDGAIKGLDQAMLDFFPDRSVAHLDDAKRAITLRHLLTMSSGIDMDNGGYRSRAVYGAADWAQAYLDRPMAAAPGTLFNYDNPGVDILARVVGKSTGRDLADYARERLFKPLGIGEYYWSQKASGEYEGYRGLALSTDSLARFGYLYLHGGRWRDKQILPADYVRESLSSHIRQSLMLDANELGYGYLWWQIPGGFAALGWGGQMVMVYPAQDMVVVFTANLGPEYSVMPIRLATNYILPSSQSSAVPAPQALAAAVRRFEASQSRSPSAPPDWAAGGPGRTYRFVDDDLGLQSFSLGAVVDGLDLTLRSDSAEIGPIRYRLPLDGRFHDVKPSFRAGAPLVAARAEWTSSDALVVEIYNQRLRETMERYILQFPGPDACNFMAVDLMGQRVRTAQARLDSPAAAQ